LANSSCARADHLYPEMYSAGVANSPFHQESVPPRPKSFGDIAHAIANIREGECCHAVLPLETLPEEMVRVGVPIPRGASPPSAHAGGRADRNLWVTGGNVTSGLHFDRDYNSLTVLKGTKRVFLFDPADTPYLCESSTFVPLRFPQLQVVLNVAWCAFVHCAVCFIAFQLFMWVIGAGVSWAGGRGAGERGITC
jgi:hypothetical protein